MREAIAFKWIKENISALTHLRDANKDNKMSSYDWFIEDEFQCLRIEYKDRSKAKFYEDGTMIELKKIQQMWSSHVGVSHYYCVVNEGKMWFWKLDEIKNKEWEVEWVTMKCPTTSHFKNREYIDKKVASLPWDRAYKVYDIRTGDEIT